MLTPVALLVAVMWAAEIVDAVLPTNLDLLGIVPRSITGLTGVVLAPFLHGGFPHLMANTVPLVVLGGLVAWRTRESFSSVVIEITLLAGLGVWLLAPAGTLTIGASGLVFGLLTYLITLGWRSRHWLDVLVGVSVILVYGGLLWGVLPSGVPAGVSWLAHLTGAVAGVVVAYSTPRGPRR